MQKNHFFKVLFHRSVFFLSLLPYLIVFPASYAQFFGKTINFDGTLYAVISRNLAIGNSHFWAIHMNNMVQDNFHEHPPLGFWIESIFFRILGDHRYTEKIYTVFTGLLLIYLVGKTWDILTKKVELKWVPQLFVVMCPAFCAIIKDNYLEIPMMIFFLLSTISSVKSFEFDKLSQKISYSLLSGLFILGALLTKPPVPFAMFSFVLFLFFIKNDRFNRLFVLHFICFCLPLLCFAIYVVSDVRAIRFLTDYFNGQFLASVGGHRDVTNPHFHVLKFLFRDFIVPIGVFVVVLLIQKTRPTFSFDKKTKILLLCALASSLPLVLSSKNMNRYIVPSYPFYAYFFTLLFLNYFTEVQKKIEQNEYKYIFISACIIATVVGFAIGFSNIGKIVKSNQIPYFESFKDQSLPNDLLSMSTTPGDPINWDYDFMYNFARENPHIAVKYGYGTDKYRVFTYPLNVALPQNCVSIQNNKQARYQIFNCDN